MLRLAIGIAACITVLATTPANGAEEPFRNPGLAMSHWPIYHANTYGTASSRHVGPGDVTSAQSVGSLTEKGFGRKNARRNRPKVSPWTVMAAPYYDGSQAVITTPNDGVAKYLITGDSLEAVDFLALERKTLDFDWGILLLGDGTGIVTEQKRERFVVFGDATPGDPRSALEVKGYIPVEERRYGDLGAHFTLAPGGALIALTGKSKLIAIDIDRKTVIAEYDLPSGSGTSFHNSFPIDETGRIYLSTQNRMAAVDWRDGQFSPAWTADYDMRGPGCEGRSEKRSLRAEAIAVARGKTCTGSGTTPTLIGDPEDGVVVIVDGHAPANNLVAFWRAAPSRDWRPLADPTGRKDVLDPQVAGIIALPYSTPEGNGFTAENSPAVLGHSIVVAQWAGFKPRRNAPRGIQRVDWNAAARRFDLIWANPEVHFNGVPTIACNDGSLCRAYGMGRYGREYRYTSIDFETGAVTGSVALGANDRVLDQGNNHAVANDGSIVYSGRFEMLRLR